METLVAPQRHLQAVVVYRGTDENCQESHLELHFIHTHLRFFTSQEVRVHTLLAVSGLGCSHTSNYRFITSQCKLLGTLEKCIIPLPFPDRLVILLIGRIFILKSKTFSLI